MDCIVADPKSLDRQPAISDERLPRILKNILFSSLFIPFRTNLSSYTCLAEARRYKVGSSSVVPYASIVRLTRPSDHVSTTAFHNLPRPGHDKWKAGSRDISKTTTCLPDRPYQCRMDSEDKQRRPSHHVVFIARHQRGREQGQERAARRRANVMGSELRDGGVFWQGQHFLADGSA